MSANNKILIIKKGKKFHIEHWDVDCEEMRDKFPVFDNLENAVKMANKFQKENEVEYSLHIVV